MRILVTGNQGYIGSVLTERLIQQGHDVEGLDAGYFSECVLGDEPQSVPTRRIDIRDVQPSDVSHFDAVIHLAALSNDPLGELNPSLTEEINLEGTIKLAQLAKDAGVKRFIYASSQSMYGISESDEELDEENSRKAPATTYAATKWAAEQRIKEMTSSDFLTVSFRPSTVYGASPRQRCDIVFNNLVASGFTSGTIVIKSDGTPWRPVVHVEDVCQAFESGLSAPGESLIGKAFNVGTLGGNFRVRELAIAAQAANPGSSIEFSGEHGVDSRTYRVSFRRIHDELGSYFRPKWNLESGAEELIRFWKTVNFSATDLMGTKVNRLAQLHSLKVSGRLDSNLRFQD